MKFLTCPVCFFQGGWEAFVNAAATKRVFAYVCKEFPPSVSFRLPEYLALFKTSGRGTSWTKIEKLVIELGGFIKEGHQSWDGGEPRFVTPDIWAEAMEAAIRSVTDPLTNHNYIRHTAYNLADMNRKKPAKALQVEVVKGPVNTLGAIPGSIDSGMHPKGKPAIPVGPISKEQAAINLARLNEISAKIGNRRFGQTPEDRERLAEQEEHQRKQEALEKLAKSGEGDKNHE
jgi:hypothetical protein